MGQLLRHSFAPPVPKPGEGLERFFVVDFVDALREVLKKGGFAEKEKDAERGGEFLVGFRDRLFTIEGDYQVGEALDGYDAVGCGSNIARGAMFATRSLGDPRQRVLTALQAAERWSSGVRAPFLVLDPGEAGQGPQNESHHEES